MNQDKPWYDVMQVCQNGHKITDPLKTEPQYGKQYCTNCGAPTTSTCEACKVEIQGWHHGSFTTSGPDIPSFCHACGQPYPWTQSRLKAARELAEEVEGLSESERESLKASLDDLVRDTPRTGLAATRFKRLVAKSGKGAAALRANIAETLPVSLISE